jgi:hydrogenase nickel incorporation protein HypA/HybF
MHELSIAQSVVDAVLERLPDAVVSSVVLQVGKLSGIAPDALRFCFELVAADTPLAGAVLQISQPDGLARCQACQQNFETNSLILLCACGSADVQILSGNQLLISSVRVA